MIKNVIKPLKCGNPKCGYTAKHRNFNFKKAEHHNHYSVMTYECPRCETLIKEVE